MLARSIRLPRRFAARIDESGGVRRAMAVWRPGLRLDVRLVERPPASR